MKTESVVDSSLGLLLATRSVEGGLHHRLRHQVRLVALVMSHGLRVCLGVARLVVLLVQMVEHVLSLGVTTSLLIHG